MARRSNEARDTTSDLRTAWAWAEFIAYRQENTRRRAWKRLVLLWLLALALLPGRLALVATSQYNGPEKIDWTVFLPEGEGKIQVELACSRCHDLRQVITQKKTRAEWNNTVHNMISMHQAAVDKEDLQAIVDYLSMHFGPTNPIEQLPMNINSSPAEALERLPGISPETARAIVESRKRAGPFASVEDLLRVKEIDQAALKKISRYIRAK